LPSMHLPNRSTDLLLPLTHLPDPLTEPADPFHAAVITTWVSDTNHFSVGNETVTFIPPDDFTPCETSTPDDKAHQVAQRIKPAKPQRLAIADNPPPRDDCLDDAIQISPSKQAGAELRTMQKQTCNEAQQPKRHGVSQAGPNMSGTPRETRTPHPANLVSE